MDTPENTRVLFVCLGNICRSPTAHGVFEARLAAHGLAGTVKVDSCGTGNWHAGEAPDGRATAEAGKRGYKLDHLRARQLQAGDFDRFHYILAMDRMNLRDLRALCPPGFTGYLGLFLPFAQGLAQEEVPDPYYGGVDGFSHVLDLVEAASEGLIQEIGRARTAR